MIGCTFPTHTAFLGSTEWAVVYPCVAKATLRKIRGDPDNLEGFALVLSVPEMGRKHAALQLTLPNLLFLSKKPKQKPKKPNQQNDTFSLFAWGQEGKKKKKKDFSGLKKTGTNPATCAGKTGNPSKTHRCRGWQDPVPGSCHRHKSHHQHLNQDCGFSL